MSQKKIFTMKESLELLPTVQALTADAVQQAEQLAQQIQLLETGPDRDELEAAYNGVVRQWAESIMSLGVEVKGLWLVDFDSGDGIYYCWRHPEPSLEYFHEYDAGFAGRRPLGRLKVS